MDVEIIGGGPGGAYAALLLQRDNPDWDVTVRERNPADETYGWGIVLPEKIYPVLRDADQPTATRLVERRTTWNPIDTYHRGERVRCGGYPYTSLMRTSLLEVLHDRCREVGVDLCFETPVREPADAAAEADLVIGADGVNSPTREAFAEAFGPSVREGSNYFSWFGTERPFEALSHIYVDTDDGLWHAGAYPGPTSTFIVSCEPNTFERAGVADMSEAEYVDYLEGVFADSLDGRDLLSKADKWRNFRRVTADSWAHDNVVLLGDAAHTAHFTIGSGTRMALEDAIALADAVTAADLDSEARPADGALAEALSAYEAERRPYVETLQDAAWRSQTFFEHVDRYADSAPIRFAFLYLTRTGHNSYERVRERDPSFVDRVERWFAERETPDGRSPEPSAPIRQPLALRETTFANRAIAVAEIPDRAPPRDEATRLSMDGEDAPAAPGLLLLRAEERPDAAFWTSVEASNETGARRNAAVGVELPAPAAFDAVSADGPRPTGVPSVEETAAGVERAAELGVDLLQLSLAPALGERGTSLNRALTAGVERVRERWPAERPLAATVPATDYDGDDAVAIGRHLGAAGADLLTVTPGSEGEYTDPLLLGRATGWIRHGTDVRTLLATHGVDTDEANTLLAGGKADLCLFAAGEESA